MSAVAIRWAFKQAKRTESAAAQFVLVTLADRFNPQYGYAWPSYRDLVQRTNLSERTVRRAVESLEEEGLVRREPLLSSQGRKIGTRYVFPSLDHELATEQAASVFDRESGEYDPERATEEAEISGGDWQL